MSPPPPTEDHTDELARLRAEHLELLRLRGEITALRREQEQKQVKAAAPATPAETADEPPTAPPVQVRIETKFYEIKAAQHSELGVFLPLWEPVPYTAQQVGKLIAALGRLDNMVAMTGPKFITLSGRTSQVTATDDGEFEGPTMKATPHVRDGLNSIILDLQVGHLIPQRVDFRATNDSPRILPFNLKQREVEPGQSLVVCAYMPQDIRINRKTGLPQLLDVATYGRHYLVAIVTPTCIDPAGYPLFPQPPASDASTAPTPEP